MIAENMSNRSSVNSVQENTCFPLNRLHSLSLNLCVQRKDTTEIQNNVIFPFIRPCFKYPHIVSDQLLYTETIPQNVSEIFQILLSVMQLQTFLETWAVCHRSSVVPAVVNLLDKTLLEIRIAIKA